MRCYCIHRAWSNIEISSEEKHSVDRSTVIVEIKKKKKIFCISIDKILNRR